MLVLASKYRKYFVNGCRGGFVKPYIVSGLYCSSEVSAALAFT